MTEVAPVASQLQNGESQPTVDGASPVVGASPKPVETTTRSKSPCVSSTQEGDHDSGVDETTQEKEEKHEVNGEPSSPAKPASRLPTKKDSGINKPKPPPEKRAESVERKNEHIRRKIPDEKPQPADPKVPMNKISVGTTASPNLKNVRSKIGSMSNAHYKPGGGNVKIESKKLSFKAESKVGARNAAYVPGGGDKKIESMKLDWKVDSKIGSLEKANHKPGGGDKKIETQKLEFKEKAKSRVGSKDNVKHMPGGGKIKIENQKLSFKDSAQSKIGSMDNVKHKPGGGDRKIFDDKEYIRQMSETRSSVGASSKASSEGRASGAQSPLPLSPAPNQQDLEEFNQQVSS